ncbi:transcriptional Coactivator p15-domain-containing protein [Lipomyces arxii]|uniref:transcriptional Coactivator p15-domain-containing protein n=1 Tax=Lipomyces arxii TaxID=56418 RepID=UPI0034CE3AD8
MPPKRFGPGAANASKKTKTQEEKSENVLDIDIGKNKHVCVRKFNGVALVDIREFYSKENADGEDVWLPGKKGISLSTEVWESLVQNIESINKAVSSLTADQKDSKESKKNEEKEMTEEK